VAARIKEKRTDAAGLAIYNKKQEFFIIYDRFIGQGILLFLCNRWADMQVVP